jgi:hypothetical protein
MFSNPTIPLIVAYAILCACCAIVTGKKIFYTMGLIIISSLLTQFVVGFITETIVIKHIFYLIVLWALSVIVLQIDILIQCGEIGGETFKIAAINSLGGSIAGAVGVLIWDILTQVVPILRPLKTLLEYLPFVGQVIDAVWLVILNLIFGLAISRNVALQQACPS